MNGGTTDFGGGILSLDNIRAWAYAQDALYSEQDEDLLLRKFPFFPLMLELANDPECPKRLYCLNIMAATLQEGGFRTRPAETTALAELADRSALEDVRLFGVFVRRLLSYTRLPFEVDDEKAQAMADDLLATYPPSPGGIAHAFPRPPQHPAYWTFRNDDGPYATYVHIHRKTGYLVIDRYGPIPAEALSENPKW